MIDFHSMARMNQAVKIAILTGIFLVIAAIAGAIFQPGWWRSESTSSPKTEWSIAGTVVDQVTNLGIGQASVTIVGRAEKDVTENNGNFRIRLQAPIPNDGTVRIHILKMGYAPDDETTTPTETLVVQLKKQ